MVSTARSLARRAALALAAVLGGAVFSAAQPPRAASAPAPPDPAEIGQTLFLIGDAGNPAAHGEPVLVALRRDLLRARGRAVVVLLGDNAYPSGLPPRGRPERAEAERRLDVQVDAVKDTGTRALFIPGNHDWENGGPDGWNAVRRQEEHIEARGGPDVSHLPDGGCPGPEVVDVLDRLRLVVLDTQWWLHGHARPADPTSSCPADSQAEVIGAFRAAVQAAGTRDVVVIAHHPLVSGGPHGGEFGFKQHLFPLTEVKRKLFIPLPLIGSLYPLARSSGITSQDQTSGAYRRMREAFASAMRDRMPLAWASGHEHVLGVIESPRWGRVLVSGSGIFGHVTYVRTVEGALYQAARSGYMRIDFLRDGRRRLGVIEVDARAEGREAFARTLR